MGRHRVYVIAPKAAKPVKIGFGRSSRKRLAALQAGNPLELFVWDETPIMYFT